MSKQRSEKQNDGRLPKDKVVFRTLSWQLKEENESGTGGSGKRGYRERTKTNILVSGRTLDKTEDGKNKSISIEITGVQLWIYIEFPPGFTKNKNNLEFFKDWLKEQLRPNEPKKFEFCKDATLLDGRRKTDLLKVYYDSINGIWGTKNRLKPTERSKMVIIGDKEYKKEDFKIHEDRVDHIVKFGKKLNIDFSGYASVPRKYLDESGDNSRCDYFARVTLDDFKPEKEPEDPPSIYYMLIDNEQYSRYHDSTFPDPQDKKNVIFQIGVLYGIVGQEKPLQKYLITMYDPHDIDDVIIIRVKTEKEVLLARYSLEGELDPDIIQHFNGLNYDLPTDFVRGTKAKIVESLRKLCSRSIHEPAEINTVSWSSKAYGKNKYSFIDAGRVQLDAKIEIERNYKLPSYSLKAVAKEFLDDNKDDITPRQLFIFFKITQDFYQKAKNAADTYGDSEMPKDKRLIIKTEIAKIFPLRYSNSLTKECRKELLEWGTGNEFFHAVRTPLTLTGKYCVQDCNVTNKLAEKKNMWEGFLQLSSITKVPVSYLQGKGQLVKVVAQIYSKCVDEGIIINSFPEKEIVDYQGAYVVDGQPGYYKNVFVEDFFSLYPTNIIAGCMDYTTYDEKQQLPEGEYIEFKWESHENCIHGHKKVNKQKKTICGNFCHRFKKIRFDEDGNPIGEGILPAVLRDGLKARVDIKFEEAVYDVAVRAHEGRLENPESDLKFYKANCEKFNVVYNDKKGGLPKHLHERYKRRKITLNARQLAVKTVLNSAYGGTGAQRGPIPHVPIAASITRLARVMITEVIDYAIKEYGKLGLFLVYGDTDSCMLCVDYMSTKDAIEFADKFARDATHMIKCFIMGLKMDYKVTAPDGKKYTLRPEKEGGFPRKWVKELKDPEERNNVYWYDYIPTKLNFEKFNEDFLFLSKKRYIANVVNNKGVKIDRVKKGCVLTRRDNPYWTRYHYQNISDMIMKGEDQKLIMDYIVDAINDLWTNIHLDFKTGKKIPYEHFIIYMGVKDLVQYAKKKNGCFVDANGNIFNPRKLDDGEFDPTDERLVYNKLKQVFLIKKINSRGTKVPSSTRLEFLYIEDAKAESDSQKAEDYLYFKEKRLEENMKVDKMYYLEKQFTNPITELVSTRYRGKAIPYEDPEVKFDRLLKRIHNKQRFETTKNTLRNYVSILKNKKQERGRRAFYYSFELDKMSKEVKEMERNGVKPHALTKDEEENVVLWSIWHLKGAFEMRELQKIEESVEDSEEEIEEGGGEKTYEIKYIIPEELLEFVEQKLSIKIINEFRGKYKTRKYVRYDYGLGRERLAIGSVIASTAPIKDIPMHTLGTIINSFGKEEGDKKKKHFTYTISFVGHGVVEGLSRGLISPIRYKDQDFLTDIVPYRRYYSEVIEEIKTNK